MKKCVICGKNIPAHRFRQTCCSDACRTERGRRHKATYRANKRAEDRAQNPLLQPRPCVVCGIDFVPNSSSTKICSKVCARQREKERRNTVQLVESTCVVCGKAFHRTLESVRTTCGHSCRCALSQTTQRNAHKDHADVSMGQKISFFDLQTGSQEFPSWNCPHMDPFTNRVDCGGVWIEQKVKISIQYEEAV